MLLLIKMEKALKILSNLKPDFFAKGFEYTSGDMPPATNEESPKLFKSMVGK